jgi:hypothetical protein
LNSTFKPIEPLVDNVFQYINFIIDTIDLHRLKNPTVNRSKCDRPGSKRQCRDRTTVKPIVLTVSKLTIAIDRLCNHGMNDGLRPTFGYRGMGDRHQFRNGILRALRSWNPINYYDMGC